MNSLRLNNKNERVARTALENAVNWRQTMADTMFFAYQKYLRLKTEVPREIRLGQAAMYYVNEERPGLYMQR
jgi:hypothetical protein